MRPPPTPSDFTRAEWDVVRRLRTPRQAQRWLRRLPYNWCEGRDTLRTLRGVVRHRTANCIEAALAAAALLEQHGYPPLLLDLESQDGLDHVLFAFRAADGRWGSVGKSRDAGLHGRRPVFRSLRDLVASYLEPYVDLTGRIVGWGVADLRDIVPRTDWRLAPGDVWAVERALYRIPHRRVAMSETRYQRALRRYREFRERHPGRQATYFEGRARWM